MKQHFVTFYSPGTFVSEQTTRPIDAWDTDAAVKMSRDITERHAAKPYAFKFTTRERGVDDLDSKVTASSGLYYLGGTILTLADVEARNDPRDSILISNMRGNDIERVVQNDNSWRSVHELRDGDTVLDYTP